MDSENACAQWFAIHVRPNYEVIVSTLLRYKGYEEFVPMRTKRRDGPRFAKQREAERPLFPSYVFVRCQWEPRLRSINSPPHPFLDIGQAVTIVSGSLRGLQGILTSKGNLQRVVVSVRLLQRSVAVEIDRANIAPCIPARTLTGPQDLR